MLIAVINLGLKSIRCIIFDEGGRKLATASRPVHTYLRSREVEQDATEWLRLMEEVSREAAAGLSGGVNGGRKSDTLGDRKSDTQRRG